MTTATCATCRHWQQFCPAGANGRDDAAGTCYRNPPVLDHCAVIFTKQMPTDTPEVWVYPVTDGQTRACGEHTAHARSDIVSVPLQLMLLLQANVEQSIGPKGIQVGRSHPLFYLKQDLEQLLGNYHDRMDAMIHEHERRRNL